MKRWRRRAGLLVASVAFALCGGLTLQTAQAVPMAATLNIGNPIWTVAQSVLGGIASGTGTLTVAAEGTAAAFSLTGTVLLAGAVYAGTTYGTYQLLKYAFPCGGGQTCEQPGAQPVGPSGKYGIQVPSQLLMECGTNSPAPTPTGFALTSACPSPSNAAGTSVTVTYTMPAWRCRNGAATCEPAAGVAYCPMDGSACSLLNQTFGGFTGSSGTAGSHSFTANIINSAGATYRVVGAGVVWNPETIEWLPAPLHRWRTITTCQNRTSGATTTNTVLSPQFTEADAQIPDMQVPQCSAGWVGTKLEIWEGDPTGAGGILRYGWTAPADVAKPVTQQTSPYKSCYPGGTDFPCVLEVWKMQPDGSLKQCGATVANDCSDFDTTTSTQQTYRCMWGTFSMPLSDCEVLADFIRTKTNQPAPQPTATATATTTTTTTLQPTTVVTTQVQPLPTTGTNIDPRTGLPRTDTTTPAPDATDDTSSNCMGAAWSWNPVNWVLIPIKCGLQWAFVPKAASMSGLSTRVTTAFNGSSPGQWVGAVDGLKAGMVGQQDGCMGPRIAWDQLPNGEMYPFAACEGIMATVAGVTKLIATVAVTFFGGLACLRALGSGLGWSPGVGRGDD